jgi:hypothetical protein
MSKSREEYQNEVCELTIAISEVFINDTQKELKNTHFIFLVL